MDIESISYKRLALFFAMGNANGLVGDRKSIRKMLALSNAADSFDELSVPPNYGLDELIGDMAGRWAMMALTMHPSLAVHPGDWLKSEIVDPHGVSINRLAACFHVTRQTLSNLFNGHTALSADMAIRFEKALWRQGRYAYADVNDLCHGAGPCPSR